MPKFKVQVDKLTVYELEVEADTREAACSVGAKLIEAMGDGRVYHRKESYPYEANFAEEVKPKTRGKE
jgi:hypothetical protein